MIGESIVPGGWFRVYNEDNEAVPPFAVMEITGLQDDDESVPVVKVGKPGADIYAYGYCLNGPKQIPANSGTNRPYGLATLGQTLAWASYDTGDSPSAFDIFGPEPSSWKLVDKSGGFVVMGEVDSENGVMLVRRAECVTLLGKPDSNVTQGNTATFSVYTGTPGSETDSTANIASVLARGQDLTTSDLCYLGIVNNSWNANLAECS